MFIRAQVGRGQHGGVAARSVKCCHWCGLGSGWVTSSSATTGSGQSRVCWGGSETSGHVKRHVGASEELK